MQNMNKKDRALLIALWAQEKVGVKTLSQALAIKQQLQLTAGEFYRNKGNVWAKVPFTTETIEALRQFRQRYSLTTYLEYLSQENVQILTSFDQSYPKLLKTISDHPLVLSVRSKFDVHSGEFARNFNNTLAVVGTRHMTSYGRLVIKTLLPRLSTTHTVVSGFMYGVDVTAARIALESGGRTIAILGFGFNHCFPAAHQTLMEDFIKQGAIFMSEFPIDTRAYPSNFVLRNRIIAGLAPATLVIEAAERSGSHITAEYANNYGRLVMAVPGPITNPYSQGTKALIQQGATLVASVEDIYQALGDDYQSRTMQNASLSPVASSADQANQTAQQVILEALSHQSGLNSDGLIAATNLQEGLLQQTLFDLEMQGLISKKYGEYCLT
jgi:DNA processing protein